MGQTIVTLTNSQRNELIELMSSTSKADVVRRALAVLHMDECETVKAVAERVDAVRKSVARWRDWFRKDGIDGLRSDGRGAPSTTVSPRLMAAVDTALEETPQGFGYLRSRWTSELLSEVAYQMCGIEAHPSTVRRLLYKLGYRWRRARPTEACRTDPDRQAKLAAIDEALQIEEPYTEVFFVDEATVDLNPRIGAEWTKQGQQPTLVTPGDNEKRYVVGALHADSRRVTWTSGKKCNSELIVDFLEHLSDRYRRANKIVLIWDNASTHHSKRTLGWIEDHPKFEVLFQPTYTPSANDIEKLWKQMHDVVTRNHRHRSMDELMAATDRFLGAATPFPGGQPGTVKLAA